MAFDRSERGHRLEQYPRRENSERDRRDRGRYDSELYTAPEADDKADYARPSDRRHWRGDEYFTEEEFERGRDYRPETRLRQASLSADHRERFLRRAESDERSNTYAGTSIGDWRRREAWNDDWRGPYVGRGPKGYRRSDERIQEDICERLTDHPGIDASDIEVTVSAGDVTLLGHVESRAVKHLTEVMVETVSGVKEVHNQLRIATLDQEARPPSAELRESRDRGRS